ncbi:hypothetical protein O181_060095 [Austropuccinia psidii MF-1]|uniref:Uncharacterized protein n=1 Tax=Austropuccinia psidii MF-1 TaxID=1389203 RepID=A0A9Q3ECR3_9BASI|nr:hypothetical protein [Austropuccinia psidii MF-1]
MPRECPLESENPELVDEVWMSSTHYTTSSSEPEVVDEAPPVKEIASLPPTSIQTKLPVCIKEGGYITLDQQHYTESPLEFYGMAESPQCLLLWFQIATVSRLPWRKWLNSTL